MRFWGKSIVRGSYVVCSSRRRLNWSNISFLMETLGTFNVTVVLFHVAVITPFFNTCNSFCFSSACGTWLVCQKNWIKLNQVGFYHNMVILFCTNWWSDPLLFLIKKKNRINGVLKRLFNWIAITTAYHPRKLTIITLYTLGNAF